MGRPKVAPMIAVRRPARGAQPKGTLATFPDEIVEICRKIYGKIYKGNIGESEGTATKHSK